MLVLVLDRHKTNDPRPWSVDPGVARALRIWSGTLASFPPSAGKIEELADYDELAARFGHDAQPAVQRQVVYGLFNRGNLLADLGRIDEAVQTLDTLSDRFAGARDPKIKEVLQRAFGLRGHLRPRYDPDPLGMGLVPDLRCAGCQRDRYRECVSSDEARRGLELLATSSMPITIDGAPQPGTAPYRDGDAMSDDGRVYVMATRQANGAPRWTLMRSEPLAAGDGGAVGAGAGGASTDDTAGASDQDSAAGAAGAVGSIPQTGSAGDPGDASAAPEGGEGGVVSTMSGGSSQLAPSAGDKANDGGCNLGRSRAPGSFGLGLALSLAALLVARKRRA